jgi:hypothetical protein
MAIEHIPGGSLVITGEHITLYQLLAMRGALKLEILGIKMTRGRAVSVGIRQLLVHPARDKRTLLTQFEAYITTWCAAHSMQAPSWSTEAK